jgi:hypothetical protein
VLKALLNLKAPLRLYQLSKRFKGLSLNFFSKALSDWALRETIREIKQEIIWIEEDLELYAEAKDALIYDLKLTVLEIELELEDSM